MTGWSTPGRSFGKPTKRKTMMIPRKNSTVRKWRFLFTQEADWTPIPFPYHSLETTPDWAIASVWSMVPSELPLECEHIVFYKEDPSGLKKYSVIVYPGFCKQEWIKALVTRVEEQARAEMEKAGIKINRNERE
jgi:hypothetical protein